MSSLANWNPFRALERREDAFEDLMREVFGRSEGGSVRRALPSAGRERSET